MPFTGITVSTEGVDELRAMLRRLPDEARKEVVVASAKAGGDYIFPYVQARVPVLTGVAKADLQSTVKQLAPGVAAADIRPGKRGWYLKFFEYGTSKMPARPVFRPAYDVQGPAAAERMIDVFWKWLEARVGRSE